MVATVVCRAFSMKNHYKLFLSPAMIDGLVHYSDFSGPQKKAVELYKEYSKDYIGYIFNSLLDASNLDPGSFACIWHGTTSSPADFDYFLKIHEHHTGLIILSTNILIGHPASMFDTYVAEVFNIEDKTKEYVKLFRIIKDYEDILEDLINKKLYPTNRTASDAQLCTVNYDYINFISGSRSPVFSTTPKIDFTSFLIAKNIETN